MDRRAKASSSAVNAKLSSSSKRLKKRKQFNNLSNGAIRRLARRGGVKRLSAMIYGEAKNILKLFLSKLIKDACIYCDFFKRNTIMAEDVVRAIQNRGQRLYGFDEKPFRVTIRSSARLVDDGNLSSVGTSSSSFFGSAETPSQDSMPKTRSSVDSMPKTRSSLRKKNEVKSESRNQQQDDECPASITSLPSTVANDEILNNDSDSTIDSLPSLSELIGIGRNKNKKNVDVIDLDND